MNSPSTKYAPKQLVFFNYHEFVSDKHVQSVSSQPLIDDTSSAEPPALLVNHFPNPYVPSETEVFSHTRIVRFPRIFDTCPESYIAPQFSHFYPGKEPGAILGGNAELSAKYMGQYFGYTSHSPLSSWIKEDELGEIVHNINNLLLSAFAFDGLSALENGLDLLTATLYSSVFLKFMRASRQKRIIDEIDAYINKLNEEILSHRHPLLKLVPVSTSAMLSLDFQIPVPGANATR